MPRREFLNFCCHFRTSFSRSIAQHSDQARAAHGMACTILEIRYRQRDITTVQKPSHAPANTPENKMKQNFLGFIPFKPQW